MNLFIEKSIFEYIDYCKQNNFAECIINFPKSLPPVERLDILNKIFDKYKVIYYFNKDAYVTNWKTLISTKNVNIGEYIVYSIVLKN